MFKIVYCLRRKEHISRKEFQKYWLEKHAPLVIERAKVVGIVKYVQSHTLDLPGVHAAFQNRNGGSPEPYDGVAEIWFERLEDLGDTDDARQKAAVELLDDEQNFIDLSRSPMWITKEHFIIP